MGLAGVVHGQTVVYVDASAPTGGNGQSWQTAFNKLENAFSSLSGQTLQGAVEVRVAHGLYVPQVLTNDGVGFALSPNSVASTTVLSINGCYLGRSSPTPNLRDFVSAATVLSGDVLRDDTEDPDTRADNAKSVIALSCGSLWVSINLGGLTIRDGWNYRQRAGGGMSVRLTGNSGALTLEKCTFRSNFAEVGGGLAFSQPEGTGQDLAITIRSCSFFDNEASDYGGGVFISQYMTDRAAPVLLEDCVFENNRASTGGGVFSFSKDVALDHCRIRGNYSHSGGGGVHCRVLHCTSSLIATNVAEFGAGGGVLCTTLSCESSTVAGNASRQDAGASVGTALISNSVFGRNDAAMGADDLGIWQLLNVSRSIVALQFQPNGRLFGGGTLSPDSAGIFSFDPHFIDPDGPDNNPATWADNNYRLSPRSPAVDAGLLDTSLSIVDLDGNDRYVSGMIGRPSMLDLGCYESQLTLCPTDIDADGGITIDDLLDFLVAFEAGLPLADLTSNGTTPFPDGGVTVDDLLFFLAKFEQGC
jgi:hypothetical protein